MKERIRYIRHFALLLAAVLMVACSDSQEPETPEVDILSRFNSEGKAYLTLQIPLGAQSMTRAVTFVDGSEYNVKDAYILIFAGTDAATATFASAYKVDNPPLANNANEQISRTITITLSDVNLNTGDNLYPFVLLNNNASAISAQSLTSVTFVNNGTPVTLEGGSSTFSDLANVEITDYHDGSGYFLMTNATLAKDNTPGADIQTLVEVPASYFFPTEAQAEANPAGHINVERLAAKATVVDGLTYYYILGNSYATFASGDLSWALDNYNTSSYAYKHLSAVSNQRFVQTNAIEPYYPLRYRTYWAEDINYNTNTNLTNNTNVTPSWNDLGGSVAQYCAENTFDVSHMQDDCTTSVLVRLQLNEGLDFYTTSVTGQDVIFQLPSNTLEEQGTSASSSFSRTRSNEVTYDGTNTATIDDYLRTWLMQNNSGFRNWVNTYAAGEVKHVAITLTNNTTTGTATVSSVTQTARTSGSGVSDFTALDLVNYFANNISLKFYVDGFCYYRVPIRHFGDETPWNSTASMTNNSTAQVYGTGDAAANNYLGRYGMVRNNWYNISIQSVTHVGSPIIPALTTDADDKVPQFLNATLNINGWEKHEQNLQ